MSNQLSWNQDMLKKLEAAYVAKLRLVAPENSLVLEHDAELARVRWLEKDIVKLQKSLNRRREELCRLRPDHPIVLSASSL